MNNLQYCLKYKCTKCPRRKECDSKDLNDQVKHYKDNKRKR